MPESVLDHHRTTYDLIIVGGGIVGASAALEAVRRGASVALVDAGLDGRASPAGAGIISPVALDRHEDRPEWTSVITRCVGHYRQLLADVDELDPDNAGSATFREVGELVVARDDPAELATLGAISARLSTDVGRRAHGVSEPPVELAGTDLHAYWPELRGDLRAIFIKDVGRVDGGRLTERLLAAASRLGCQSSGSPAFRIIPGWASLDPAADRPIVQVGSERLSAPAVLLATGAWAGSALDAMGLDGQIRPVRGQIVHLRLPGAAAGGRPVVNTLGAGYLLGFDDRIVVGATHEDAGFDASVTAEGQHRVLAAALDLAPGLGTATLLQTRVGLRPVSRDGLPSVGAVAAGIHVATGLGAMINKYHVSPTLQQTTDTDPEAMLTSGKVAMRYCGSWEPEEIAAVPYGKANIDIAPLPTGPAGNRDFYSNGLANVIAAKTKHPQQAWEFVQFLGSKRAAEIQATTGTVIPAYKGEATAYTKAMPEYDMKVFVDQLQYAEPFPSSLQTATWRDYATQQFANAWTGKSTVADVAHEVAARMNKDLAAEKP
ncbi:FAD-dependent oxidoreductase [Microlunatus endophyticus]|uniref:FAD-dependent oxidoreductase n=1 Tax=Microlunatus endophyticus TaxID=1716077 RepID=UPI00166A360A|nr:FAD-dependent oxidoreductase [Microlunatus endophyticus]